MKTETGSTQGTLWTRAELKESAGPRRTVENDASGERVLVSVPSTEILAMFQYVLPASLIGRDKAISAYPYVEIPSGTSFEEIKRLLRERFEEALEGMLKHYDVVVETLASEQEAAPAGT